MGCVKLDSPEQVRSERHPAGAPSPRDARPNSKARWFAVAAALVCALGTADLASAQLPANVDVHPGALPTEHKRLVVRLRGDGIVQRVKTGITVSQPGALLAPLDTADGPYYLFAHGKNAGAKISISLPTGAKEVAFLRPENATDPLSAIDTENGMTVAFWYRFPAAVNPVAGTNPLVVFTDPFPNPTARQFALVLVDGRPTIHVTDVEDSLALSTLTSTKDTAGLGTVADGKWHHIALRLARPGCTEASCPNQELVLTTLWVDEEVREERYLKLSLDKRILNIGEMAVHTSAFEQARYTLKSGAEQNNLATVGGAKVLNTVANIKDLVVYDAALARDQVARHANSMRLGLRWQLPNVDPRRHGFWKSPTNEKALDTARPPLSEFGEMAGSVGAIGIVGAPGTGAGEQSVGWLNPLRHLKDYTLAFWVDLASSDHTLLSWAHFSTTVLGAQDWTLARVGKSLVLTCLGNNATVEVPLSSPLPGPELITVTFSPTGDLQLGYNLFFSPLLPCAVVSEGAPKVFEAEQSASLLWSAPLNPATGAGRLRWMVLLDRFRSPPEVAELASPGASLSFPGSVAPFNESGSLDVEDTAQLIPLELIGATPAGPYTNGLWTSGHEMAGRMRAVGAVVDLPEDAPPHLLAGLDVLDADPPLETFGDHSAAASLTVSQWLFDPSKTTIPLVSRIDGDGVNGDAQPPFNVDFAVRLVKCDGSLCSLEIETRGASPNVPNQIWSVDYRFRVDTGNPVRIGVSWPFTKPLLNPAYCTPAGELLGKPVARREPLVAINGLILNRETSCETNHIRASGWGYAGPIAGDSWAFGDPDGGGAANNGLYLLSSLRAYGRPVDDIAFDGARASDPVPYSAFSKESPVSLADRCEAEGRTLKTLGDTSFCGDCAPGSIALGGIPGTDTHMECSRRARVGERCARDSDCASGPCLASSDATIPGGFCGVSNPTDGANWCQVVLGRKYAAATQGCGDCLPYHYPEGFPESQMTATPVDPGSPEIACTWRPRKRALETCSENWECDSGRCIAGFDDGAIEQVSVSRSTQSIMVYDTSPSSCCTLDSRYACGHVSGVRITNTAITYSSKKSNRCAARTQAECTAEPVSRKVAATVVGYLPSFSQVDAYQCGTPNSHAPSAGANGCMPNYTPQNLVLDGAGCQKLMEVTDDETFPCNTKCGGFLDLECRENGGGGKTSNRYNLAWSTTLTLAQLKELLGAPKNSDGSYTYRPNPDYAWLLKQGAGPLLIAYLGADPAEKQKLEAEYGQFLPLANCATGWPTAAPADSVYVNGTNLPTCLPERQADGAPCPPANVSSMSTDAWCYSNYCSREDKTCRRGDNPLQEFGGNGGKKGDKGKAGVSFGLVRLDDLVVNGTPSSGGAQKANIAGQMGQSYVAFMLGQPVSLPGSGGSLLTTDVDFDKTQDAAGCSKNTARAVLLGMDIPLPKANAAVQTGFSTPFGGCTAVTGLANCDEAQAECSFSPEEGLESLLDSFLSKAAVGFCLPIATKQGVNILEQFELRKSFKEFLVPVVVTVGPTFDMCVSFAFALDAEEGMPQFEVKPSVGVGVEAKAGVGDGETGAYEVSAGVRIALTIVDMAFPATFGLRLEEITECAVPPCTGLSHLDVVIKLGMELTLLSGEMGVYAALTLGLLSFEWTFNFFEWTGIKLSFDLAEIPVFETILDFAKKRDPTRSSPGRTQCDPTTDFYCTVQ